MYGNFAREEVLQAMLHSQGDLENAVDEMNSKWLQLFHDRHNFTRNITIFMHANSFI
jgi:hypothetical protein